MSNQEAAATQTATKPTIAQMNRRLNFWIVVFLISMLAIPFEIINLKAGVTVWTIGLLLVNVTSLFISAYAVKGIHLAIIEQMIDSTSNNKA